jgi:hypothetical protein
VNFFKTNLRPNYAYGRHVFPVSDMWGIALPLPLPYKNNPENCHLVVTGGSQNSLV